MLPCQLKRLQPVLSLLRYLHALAQGLPSVELHQGNPCVR